MKQLIEELESSDVKVQATALLQLLNLLATDSEVAEAVTAACKARAPRELGSGLRGSTEMPASWSRQPCPVPHALG